MTRDLLSDSDDDNVIEDEFSIKPSIQGLSHSHIESNTQRQSLANTMNASMTTMKQCQS